MTPSDTPTSGPQESEIPWSPMCEVPGSVEEIREAQENDASSSRARGCGQDGAHYRDGAGSFDKSRGWEDGSASKGFALQR